MQFFPLCVVLRFLCRTIQWTASHHIECTLTCVCTVTHPLPQRLFAPATNPTPQPQPSAPAISAHPIPNPPVVPQPTRAPRSRQDVEQARADRKADIEYRCQTELQPPLMPDVLRHIPSFQAAMQITTPLTDHSWNLLKERLVSQRDEAANIEYQRASYQAALQSTISQPNPYTYTQASQEADNKKWELEQEPLRRELGGYADETITARWQGGKAVNLENCPNFAAEVLLFVKKQHTDVYGGHPTSSDLPNNKFLSLDSMKWVFVHKVKPITDKFRRDLFVCIVCNDRKFYAFEGLIQHYGAKHTSEFSKDNVVVHWPSAAWPDEPPFDPRPAKVRSPSPPQVLKSKVENQSANPWSAFQRTDFFGGLPLLVPHIPDPPRQIVEQVNMVNVASSQTRRPSSSHSGVFSFLPGKSYDDRLNEFVATAQEIWDLFDNVMGMSETVRIYTAFHHAIKRYRPRFGSEPELDLVADALGHHPRMQSIKYAALLFCKVCADKKNGDTSARLPTQNPPDEVTQHSVLSFINHVKSKHLSGSISLPIAMGFFVLPDKDSIFGTAHLPGMNDNKLAILGEVFPDAFPTPLPSMRDIRGAYPLSDYERRASVTEQRGTKRKLGEDNESEQSYQNDANYLTEIDSGKSETLPEAADDEYDPRRPAFVTTEGDNHTQRNNDTGWGAPVDDETLARLSAHYGLPLEFSKKTAPRGIRKSRSPSVPRLQGPHVTSQLYTDEVTSADNTVGPVKGRRDTKQKNMRKVKRRKAPHPKEPKEPAIELPDVIRSDDEGYDSPYVPENPQLATRRAPVADPAQGRYPSLVTHEPYQIQPPVHAVSEQHMYRQRSSSVIEYEPRYFDGYGNQIRLHPVRPESRPLAPASPLPQPTRYAYEHQERTYADYNARPLSEVHHSYGAQSQVHHQQHIPHPAVQSHMRPQVYYPYEEHPYDSSRSHDPYATGRAPVQAQEYDNYYGQHGQIQPQAYQTHVTYQPRAYDRYQPEREHVPAHYFHENHYSGPSPPLAQQLHVPAHQSGVQRHSQYQQASSYPSMIEDRAYVTDEDLEARASVPRRY